MHAPAADVIMTGFSLGAGNEKILAGNVKDDKYDDKESR